MRKAKKSARQIVEQIFVEIYIMLLLGATPFPLCGLPRL